MAKNWRWVFHEELSSTVSAESELSILPPVPYGASLKLQALSVLHVDFFPGPHTVATAILPPDALKPCSL